MSSKDEIPTPEEAVQQTADADENLCGEHGAQEKRNTTKPGPVYDNVFRTVIDRMGRVMILLVNDLFGTTFSGDEEITFKATEVPVRTPDGKYRAVRTDSHFVITDKNGTEHIFHIECQVKKDGTILFRIAEYDLALALHNAVQVGNEFRIKLPSSALIVLRDTLKQGEEYAYVIDGEGAPDFRRRIHTLSVRDTSVDEMFERKLYALLPFYLFTHGDIKLLQNSDVGQRELIAECEMIRQRIDNEEQIGTEDKARLFELTAHVIKALITNKDLEDKMEGIMYTGTIPLAIDREIKRADKAEKKLAVSEEREAKAREQAAEARKQAAAAREQAAEAREQAAEAREQAAEARKQAAEAREREEKATKQIAEANSMLKRYADNYIRMRFSAKDSNADIVEGLAQMGAITQGEAQSIFDRYVAEHSDTARNN